MLEGLCRRLGRLIFHCDGIDLPGEDVLHDEDVEIALGGASAVVYEVCRKPVFDAGGYDGALVLGAWQKDLALALASDVGVNEISGDAQATALRGPVELFRARVA